MGCDTGVVQQAGWYRAQLLGKESPPPLVTPLPSPMADALVPPPIVAHPGPALFSHTPSLEPVAPGSVIILPTIQNVPAVLSASDMPVNTNIDPMLLTESTPFTRDANASIDPMLLTQSLTSSQPPSGETSSNSEDFTGDAGIADSPQAPPCTQLHLSVTQVIPPMPFDGGDDSVLQWNNMLPQEGSDPSTPSSGCQTATVNKILKDGYKQLKNTLMTIIAQTSLSAQQVLDGWYKTHGCVIYSMNCWNSYARYIPLKT